MQSYADKYCSAILIVKFIKTEMCNFGHESFVVSMLRALEHWDRGFESRSGNTGYNSE
jgi:hypothetical protein